MFKPLVKALPLLLLGALFVPGLGAQASSTPIGTLPPGTKAATTTARGSYVAVALPHRANGLVWRIARPFAAKVLTEVGEADVGKTVVVVFRANAPGDTKVIFALTKGDTGARAYDAFTQSVHVR